MREFRYVLIGVLVSLLVMAGAWPRAQEATSAPPQVASAPTLTNEDKLHIQNVLQKIEIAQLKFDAAKNELMSTLKRLEREGYTLDLQTLTYVKKDTPSEKK